MNRNLNCSYMTISSSSALSLTALLLKYFKLTITAFKFFFCANYYSVDFCWLWKLGWLIQMKKITLKYSWPSQIRWSFLFVHFQIVCNIRLSIHDSRSEIYLNCKNRLISGQSFHLFDVCFDFCDAMIAKTTLRYDKF